MMDEAPPIPPSTDSAPPVPVSTPSSSSETPIPVNSQKGRSCWTIGFILFLILSVGLVALGGAGYWAFKKFAKKMDSAESKESGILSSGPLPKAGQDLVFEMAKKAISAQEGIEVVSADKASGKITIRDRESGETISVNLKEIQSGDFSFLKQFHVPASVASADRDTSALQPGSSSVNDSMIETPSSEEDPSSSSVTPSESEKQDKDPNTLGGDMTSVGANDAQRVEKYRQAAEQGEARAQCNLGYLYFTGRGVKKNISEALRWYRQSAEQGYASAQYNLGLMYHHGYLELPKNQVQSAVFFRKAAEQGHAKAQRNLGRMYARGNGVSKNEVEAFKWLTLASTQGQGDDKLLGELASRIPPEKVMEIMTQIQSRLQP